MNEDDSPIFLGSVSKNVTQNVGFTASELSAVNARQGDLVISIYFFNKNGDYSPINPVVSSTNTGGQTWTTYSGTILDGEASTPSAEIGARMYYCRFNGTWTGTFQWTSNTSFTDAQIATVFAYRMIDSATSFSLFVPDTTGSAQATTQNGWQTTAANDVILNRYTSSINDRKCYLFMLLACAGDDASTTAITLTERTNTGWVQDVQFTRANSGYTIARVYTWKTAARPAATTNMPEFAFDRTNGQAHGLFTCLFHADT